MNDAELERRQEAWDELCNSDAFKKAKQEWKATRHWHDPEEGIEDRIAAAEFRADCDADR